MTEHIPYFRWVAAALGAASILAFLLNLSLRDWIASLHLAVVLTFMLITIVLSVHALVVAIIEWRRRNRDDPPGHQQDFDLAG